MSEGDVNGSLRTLMRVELSNGTWVVIEASGPITSTSIEELLEYVMVYERHKRKQETDQAMTERLAKCGDAVGAPEEE